MRHIFVVERADRKPFWVEAKPESLIVIGVGFEDQPKAETFVKAQSQPLDFVINHLVEGPPPMFGGMMPSADPSQSN